MANPSFTQYKAVVADCHVYWNSQIDKAEQATEQDIRLAVDTMSAAEIMACFSADKNNFGTKAPKWCQEPKIIDIYRKYEFK